MKRADIKKGQKRKGVFLDRDGTINIDTGYLHKKEELELIPGSAEAIKILNRMGFIVACISNQSGVARGYFSIDTVRDINISLLELLAMHGAHIDGFYFCPHHPTEGAPPYRRECRCRKPGIGMIEKAVAELNIDLSHSFLIGDHLSDIQTAYNAGIKSSLVLTGHGLQELAAINAGDIYKPDYVAQDLFDAVDWIAKTIKGLPHQKI